MTARQEEVAADPGLAALVLIARFHSVAADASQLRHAAALKTDRFGERDLVLAARSLGLKARAVTVNAARLARTPFPALLLDKDGQHCVLAGCDATRAMVLECGAATPTVNSPEEIVSRSGGRLLLFASRASLAGELARFDFSWFIPAVVKYRRLLLEVLLVSLLLQVFGLVSPLMFQVVMDKRVGRDSCISRQNDPKAMIQKGISDQDRILRRHAARIRIRSPSASASPITGQERY